MKLSPINRAVNMKPLGFADPQSVDQTRKAFLTVRAAETADCELKKYKNVKLLVIVLAQENSHWGNSLVTAVVQ